MTKQERGRVLQALLTLAAAFDQEVSPERLDLYVDRLAALPLEAVVTAVTRAMDTKTYFPAIAELRALAGADDPHAKQALEDQAVLAWESLRRLKGRLPYNPEALTDPLTMKAFRALGGRNGFGQWDYEKHEEWKRKEFVAVYQAAARAAAKGDRALTHEESVPVLMQVWGGAE